MSRRALQWLVLAALGLGCHRPDPRVPALQLEAVELRLVVGQLGPELVELRTRLEAAELTAQGLASALEDVRALALVGGPPRRFRGVDCHDGPFLPESFGARAHRALHASTWCPLHELAAPRRRPALR